MGDPRAELFATLGNNDSRFARTVFFQPVPNRREVDYVSVDLEVDWPSNKDGPMLFRDIEDSREKLPVFNLIYSLKSFLERALFTKLDLIEIHTGCIRVVFQIKDQVPQTSVAAGLDQLLKNKERYHAISASARLGQRRVY